MLAFPTRVFPQPTKLATLAFFVLAQLWKKISSSGSSGGVRGAEKHEIYVAAFSGGHLFYDLLSQGQGGHGPLDPPHGSATD